MRFVSTAAELMRHCFQYHRLLSPSHNIAAWLLYNITNIWVPRFLFLGYLF